MFTREELVDAVNQISASSHHSIQNCEKLAAIYTVLDHLQPTEMPLQSHDSRSEVIGRHGESNFLKMITGKEPRAVWKIVDEMVDAVSVFNPKLHRAFLDRISALDDKIIDR